METHAPQTPEAPLPQPMKKTLTYPLLGLVFIFILAGVAYVSYTLGKKSQAAPQKESVEFVANNFEVNVSPTTTREPSITGPVKPTITKIILATPELDGYIESDGTSNSQKDIQVGRNVDSVSRGLVSFDLTALPTGITIKAAQLRLYEKSTIGTPYTSIGEIRIDHLTYGDSIDNEDYSRPALIGNFASLSSSKRQGWKEVDVTDLVRDDIANVRSTSQYRVHFSLETSGGTNVGDYAVFEAADRKNNDQPQLVIEYY